MVWVILLVALGVLGLGAFAASGRLGEMPPPVDSRPVGRIPEGELTPDTIGDISFSTVMNGYDKAQVDDFLAGVASGEVVVGEGSVPQFDVVRNGYSRSEVDGVFDRLAGMGNNRGVLRQEEMRQAHGSDEATHG